VSRSEHERDASQTGGRQPPRLADPSLKAVGLVVAWIGGVACGWRVFQQSNLLDAVLRGAGAWLALMVLWLGALAFCQRLVCVSAGQPRAPGDDAGNQSGAGEPGGGPGR
jgi:hypothetical protein